MPVRNLSVMYPPARAERSNGAKQGAVHPDGEEAGRAAPRAPAGPA